jgi:hypothetical protein
MKLINHIPVYEDLGELCCFLDDYLKINPDKTEKDFCNFCDDNNLLPQGNICDDEDYLI